MIDLDCGTKFQRKEQTFFFGGFWLRDLAMGDHLVVHVDRLITPQRIEPEQVAEGLGSSGKVIQNVGSSALVSSQVGSSSHKGTEEKIVIDDGDEKEPLIQTVECRICQEEDDIKNLETPCACSGSLKVYYLWHLFLILYQSCI